jgi:hypothetical protein
MAARAVSSISVAWTFAGGRAATPSRAASHSALKRSRPVLLGGGLPNQASASSVASSAVSI